MRGGPESTWINLGNTVSGGCYAYAPLSQAVSPALMF